MKKLILIGIGAALLSTDFLFFASAANAQSCIQPPPGMVSWWPGDGDATDIVGNNDGVPIGDTIFVAGQVDEAFDFDGSGDSVTIPADPSLEFSGDFTVDLWVNLDTQAQCNYKSFVNHQDFPSREGWILVDNCPSGQDILFRTLDGVVTDAKFSRTLLVPGTWHHVAGVHQGTSNKIYLDGVLKDARSGAAFQPNVGANLSSGAGVDGRFDEIEIFDRALSTSEIQAIYDAGTAGKCKPSTVVDIDIKPGSFPNSINLGSGGATPVAILGSASLDANDIDTSTLTLGTSGVKTVGKTDRTLCSVVDVSGDFSSGPEGVPDGFNDLVCHFVTMSIVPEAGDAQATLSGALNDTTPIEGTDSVNIVP
jgi:hypothetical protein